MTKASTRECWHDHRLWPNSNEIFVPVPEPLISIYVRRGVFLTLRTGAGYIL
jgi:hypothetical protein